MWAGQALHRSMQGLEAAGEQHMGSGMIRRFGRPDMQEVYGVISKCSLQKIAHWSDRKDHSGF